MRTHLLIDQLAELAGQRNGDALDACFLDLFHDLLSPQSVAILRPNGEESAPVWTQHRKTRTRPESRSVKDVLLAFPTERRRAVQMGLMWMCKLGMLDWL